MLNLLLLVITVLVTFFAFSLEKQLLITARNNHLPQDQSNEQVEYLADLSNITHIQEVFDNLLVPRVVGTPSHEKVFRYIIKELENLGWHIEVDEFQDETPNFGKLTFKNVVATLNPDANRFLTLACHYDSKFFKDNDFIGATDSAVPCAMMINLAKVMKPDLDKLKSQQDLSLKLIFFDGEEAFVEWGPTDSIYGAKHLASKLHHNLGLTTDGETVTDLTRIDVLVLLDLIGVANPKFYCFFEETQRWYERLSDAEERLAHLGLLKSYAVNNPNQIYFNRRTSFSFVEDDHIPFLQRRVPIVHLIPSPFPKEWHTAADNRDIIDIDTVENINKILRVFVAEYLGLSVLDGHTKGKKHQVEL